MAYQNITSKEADRIIKEYEKEKNTFNCKRPLDFNNSGITKHDYVLIPQHNKAISKFELPGHNNLNWKEQHFRLQEKGLYMPSPKIFIGHFLNVVESYQGDGKKPLFDANGNPIPKKETEDIALHLLEGQIPLYPNKKGTFTYLDAYFERDPKDNNPKFYSNHKAEINSNGERILVSEKTQDLENYLGINGIADLKDSEGNPEFNSQGLPNPLSLSLSPGYKPGRNIRFMTPSDKKVASFNSGPEGTLLSCKDDPHRPYPFQGTFGVAESNQINPKNKK